MQNIATRWSAASGSPLATDSATASRSLGADRPATSPVWWLLAAGALLLAMPAVLIVDCPLARWCLDRNCPRLARDFLRVCELFGHGLGLLVIVLAIHQLDPLRRWTLPRVLVSSLGAGLAANVVKLLVSRARPSGFDFDTGVWASFGGWFPLLGTGSGGQSFPSAHVATAAGLAVALTSLYPAGRKLFLALVVLVACQRIETSSHFLSDVVAGAAVGLAVGAVVLKMGRREPYATGARWVASNDGEPNARAA